MPICPFVTSRLDFSLLPGCPKKSPKTPKLNQNAAVQILTGTRKRYHISPVLASLHWLPIKFRKDFKILLLIYKDLIEQIPTYFKKPYKADSQNLQICKYNWRPLVSNILYFGTIFWFGSWRQTPSPCLRVGLGMTKPL